MSAITIGGDLVHYEVLGRGRPVILIHGWLGSWRYWIPTIQQLQLKYRVYALDLFGFGDSGKNPEKYPLTQQVRLLDEFMKVLGIPKAAVVGHGLGALVALEFARDHADRVARLLIASAPLFDPGDLETRTPAGHVKVLTANVPSGGSPTPPPVSNLVTGAVPLSAPTPPSTSPVVSPALPASPGEAPKTDATVSSAGSLVKTDTTTADVPKADPDSTVPSKSISTPLEPLSHQETIVRRPDPSHFEPTIRRISDDDKARLATAYAAMQTGQANQDSPPASSPSGTASAQAMAPNSQNPLLEIFAGSEPEGLLAKCFKPSEAEYDKLKVDVVKSDALALKSSAATFDSGRMLDTLRLLPIPTVVVHGVEDAIIPRPPESVWNYLTLDKEDTLLPIPLPGVRHFPMLEHEGFIRLVNQFLEIADLSKLEMKERWTRRTR